MTGFRADADPPVFDDARITGTYILDPWYPRVSSIWGPSDPPGTFQDEAEMGRNFLNGSGPEGHYPDRDGLYIIGRRRRSSVPGLGAARPAASATAQEEREQRVLGRHPDRIAERDGQDPDRADEQLRGRRSPRPKPANDAATWRIVSCVAYSPRESG